MIFPVQIIGVFLFISSVIAAALGYWFFAILCAIFTIGWMIVVALENIYKEIKGKLNSVEKL